jgi:hypothetical protein
MITINELERVWEGSDLAHISRYISDWYGGSKENHENIMIRYHGRNSNRNL